MKFSIIIPVYKTEHLLTRCLDSLAQQTDGDFEAIVVDDGSPREESKSKNGATCSEIVAQYDGRFRYVLQPENRGPYQARVRGVEEARGDYIVPLDSDDYVMPQLLEELRKIATDVVVYQMMFDRNGKIAKSSIRYKNEFLSGAEALDRMLDSKIQCAIWGKAIRREVFLKAMEDLAAPRDLYLNSSEDLLQAFPILMHAQTVATISYPGYRYCINRSDSLTGSLTDPARMGRAAENTARVFEMLAGLVRRTYGADQQERSERLLARLEDFRRTTARWYLECVHSLSSTERRACEAELARHLGNTDAISQEVSKKISLLSFVFSIAVVVIHCAWTAETEVGRLSIELFRNTLARIAVPFFFVCSGYLIAWHFDETGWWLREVRKRVRSLGIPYLVWTFVLACVLFLETREVLDVRALGINLCRRPALIPLWYVRGLMLFVLSLPLFKTALDRGKGLFLACLFVAAFVSTSLVWTCGLTDEKGLGCFLIYGYSLEGLFFFLSGVYLQRHRRMQIAKRNAALLLAFGLGLVAVKLLLVHCQISLPVNFNLLITPFLLVGLWGTLKPLSLPRGLSGCAFSIFLMHTVVLSALRNVGGTYHPCNPWLEFSAGVIVPILFVNLVRRYLPQAGRILFGGRI